MPIDVGPYLTIDFVHLAGGKALWHPTKVAHKQPEPYPQACSGTMRTHTHPRSTTRPSVCGQAQPHSGVACTAAAAKLEASYRVAAEYLTYVTFRREA